MTVLKKAGPGEADCFFVGLNVVDVLAVTDRPLEDDRKIPARRIIVDGGGPSGNSACACARAGARAALVSVIGQDEWTGFSLGSLVSFGVDHSLVRVRQDFKTPVSLIIVNAATAGRTILWNSHGINEIDLRLSGPETRRILAAPLVQFDGHLMTLALSLATRIRASGGAVCYDCGSPRPGWEELAAQTDYFIASHAFARQLGRPLAPLVLELRARFGFHVAVTAGGQGYYYFNELTGAAEFVPQRKFEAVDTTGCGDAFHGAFAAAISRGGDFRAALDFAQEFAGRKAQGCGGRAALPDLKFQQAWKGEPC
ncbi:MAG: PfkB family carbohydrate kinase [Elusimicrobiaceae bacterium]|nr:PfkB family carbohydrate kinase [Elusimicrobiaceae bacterium]